ncbi:OLC1v1027683C1 [Oldenlandia corymbosa var. corymbosa]|uniref:OLC1v1027683C1 n=1 Tax=Oldenlandia corymbosa var. corymbosa TaxID=529605 RepID=A0AAV1CAT6_OLDCO|nr:OLC1v1027683C1 [Oldenlandia corymbosa var. corymbosa]
MLGRQANSRLKPQLVQSLSLPTLRVRRPASGISSFPEPQNFPSCRNLIALLSSCKTLNGITQIHALLITTGLQFDTSSNTHLIAKYASFQRCQLSRLVFDSVKNPGVVLWNSMIRAYATTRQYKEALQCYHLMKGNLIHPDKYTFTFALKACTGTLNLDEGRLIHREIVDRKLQNDVFIATALVDMYCKMSDLVCARVVFDGMPHRDIVTWNSMISGLAQSAEPSEALEFFKHMQLDCGVEPNAVSLLNLFPAVCKLTYLKACRSIHGYIWRRDFPTAVLNGLIDMYVKCASPDVARFIFDRMVGRDDVTWGSMMAGYAYNGRFSEVLELFDDSRRKNLMINKVSAVNALLAASELRDMKKGVQIHESVVRQKIDSDISVATSLVTMYAKCGLVERAAELFWRIPEKDIVAWSAVVAAFAQSGNFEEAISVFRDMQNQKMKPNAVTLVSVLPACAELLSPNLGKSVHCCAVKDGVDYDISVGTALVSMYAKCTLFPSALIVFDRLPYKETVTWNALINAYAQIGEPYHAIEMFNKMILSDLRPDSGTMVGLLPVCALLGNLNQGSCMHGQVIKYGLESDCHVKNAVIDMYAKCRSLSAAEYLFKQIEFDKDEVSWNVMIAGYMHNGCAKDAMSAFCRMHSEAFKPNLVTIVSILPAMTFLTALKEGMAVHAYILQRGFQSSVLAGNGLVDLYAKCGRLDYSKLVFIEMKNKDTVSWNTMLSAYSVHGLGDAALGTFALMEESEVNLGSVSFTSVLSACRHAGLIEEGRKIFRSMKQRYNIEPSLEHYACMVDLFGRAGLFDEILDLIKEMPMQPDAGVWGALLDACRRHSNIKLGELALKNLTNLELGNMAHYVVLSSLYCQSGRWNDAGNTRSRMNTMGLEKTPGCSWLDTEEHLQVI